MSPTFWLTIEKVIATYVQSLIGLVILDLNDTLNTQTPTMLAIAALPAAITVISASIPAASARLPYVTQLVLNTARTFVQGFFGYLLAIVPFRLDASVGQAAAFAALPAALAFLKGGLARYVGNSSTPNLLPVELDPGSYPQAVV